LSPTSFPQACSARTLKTSTRTAFICTREWRITPKAGELRLVRSQGNEHGNIPVQAQQTAFAPTTAAIKLDIWAR
jgi:hypothetical protein